MYNCNSFPKCITFSSSCYNNESRGLTRKKKFLIFQTTDSSHSKLLQLSPLETFACFSSSFSSYFLFLPVSLLISHLVALVFPHCLSLVFLFSLKFQALVFILNIVGKLPLNSEGLLRA